MAPARSIQCISRPPSSAASGLASFGRHNFCHLRLRIPDRSGLEAVVGHRCLPFQTPIPSIMPSSSDMFPENIPPSSECAHRHGAAARPRATNQIPDRHARPACDHARTHIEESADAPQLPLLHVDLPNPAEQKPRIAPRPKPAPAATNCNCWRSPDCRKLQAHPAREFHLRAPAQCSARTTRCRAEAWQGAATSRSPVLSPA